jgi:hypothetical protein
MVTFAVSGHRRGLRRIVHAAILVPWVVGEMALLALWAEAPAVPSALRLALWTAAGAALAWNCVRRGAGRETLTVTPTLLVHERAVGPFRFRRRYELARIRRPRLSSPASRRFLIEFDYDGRTRRFGRNLTAPEATCVVSMIRRALLPAGWAA